MNTKAQPLDLLTAWTEAGARLAASQEDGWAYYDLHRENIGRMEDGRIYNVDPGAAKKISYPDEWRRISIGLMSLLSWLPIELAAGFRYGYLHHSRHVGLLIFDNLRTDFAVTAFRSIRNANYTAVDTGDGSNQERIFQRDEAWRKKRGTFNLGDLAHLELADIGKWLHRRGDVDSKDILEADEYHFEKHLVAAEYHRSIIDVFQAMLNLRRLYSARGLSVKAFGVALHCHHLCERYSDKLPPEIKAQVSEEFEVAVAGTAQHVMQDLSQIPDVSSVFHWLWCLDDYVAGNLSWDR